jgi:hypothetical protein
MREILVNALIHRDYSIAGGAVSLAIFDERVEVWSAGRFPAGITPESLMSAHPSVQRNRLVAIYLDFAELQALLAVRSHRRKVAGIAPGIMVAIAAGIGAGIQSQA